MLVKRRNLLLAERIIRRYGQKIVSDLILLHRRLGRLHLRTEIAQAAVQPVIGFLGGLELGLQLLGQIEARPFIGDPRRLFR